MNYPTLKEVEAASRYQLCKWHRFLPYTSNEAEIEVSKRLLERFYELGGFTPELSKQIGWDAK